MQPVTLDLDGSLGPMPGGCVLALRTHADALRFACSSRALRRFAAVLENDMPSEHGTVFTGSGDFHHLSLPLIARAARRHGPLQVVVFDNHPDNMRFAFGVHCGSWVRRAVALPNVAHVHVVGITSIDIGLAHAWENRLWPLFARRLTYWSCGVDTSWTRWVGLRHACRAFDDMQDLLQAFAATMAVSAHPVYLSIDKDVLSIDDVRTNWDQGRMREHELIAAITALRGRIVGSDITGEVSAAHYRQRWKRALSALDRQASIPVDCLRRWQADQHALNLRLLPVIDAVHAHAAN